MKIILALFFYLLSYSILHSQTDSSFYFPMKSGNLWQYKEPPPPDDPYITEIRTGRDTTFPNGQTYRSFLVDTYGYPDTGLQAYRRQIGDKVYRYFPSQQKEYLIYDFSKGVRDTVAVYPSPIEPGDTNVIIVLATGIQNIFGKMRKYMVFYNKEFPTTEYWIDQITDSIGITSSETEPGYQLSLVGAIVDSVCYGTVTSVLPTVKLIPKTFMLYQNFPNPFNPSTVISYQLKAISHVTLKVYDILGREVVTLVDGLKEAGSYTATFHSDRLASGIYFARFVASPEDGNKPFTKIVKMLLMK